MPYYLVPPDVARNHSFIHFLVETPANNLRQFESTEGHCLQIQVKFGKVVLVLAQDKEYATCSSLYELNRSMKRMKAFLKNPDELQSFHQSIALSTGDCVVIPPGTMFSFSESGRAVISGSKFLCREALHLTYPWMHLADFANVDQSVSRYWAVMKGIVGESTTAIIIIILLISH